MGVTTAGKTPDHSMEDWDMRAGWPPVSEGS